MANNFDDAGINRIVPFGKYKGQSLATLRQDHGYLEWLSAQEGIRRNYPWIFSITINSAAEPAETPEHNRYQALFLDDAFATRLYDLVCPGYREEVARNDMIYAMHDARMYEASKATCAGPVCPAEVTVGFEANWRERDGIGRDVTYGPADVQIVCCERVLRIEIKPVIGDDYPAVLRQMKASKCNILYLVAYTGVGATLAQVRKMFGTAGIRIIMHYTFADDLF